MVRINELKTDTTKPLNPNKSQNESERSGTEASTSKLFFATLTGISIFAGINCFVRAMKATSPYECQRLALAGQLFGIAATICSGSLRAPKTNAKKPESTKTSKLFFAALTGINTAAGISCSVIAEKVTSPPLKLGLILSGQLFSSAACISSLFYVHAYWKH